MDPQDHARISSAYRLTALTCAAVTGVLPMLVVVLFILDPASEASGGSLGPLPGIFIALALLVVAFDILVVPRLRDAALARAMADPSTVPVPGPSRTAPDSVDAAVQTLRSWTLVEYALGEMPALLGFVLAVMAGEWAYFIALAALTALTWAVKYPRLSAWTTSIERAMATPPGTSPIVG